MTPERKKKALELIDTAHPSTGILPSGLQALRDLIDPPISALSRAELETEVADLRKLVETQRIEVEQHKELANVLSHDFDSLRLNVRRWENLLRNYRATGYGLEDLVCNVASEKARELRKSDD